MDVHPAELALEPLPAVPLHDLAAHVARGDVLEGVLCKLVVGLKDRGRLHLDIKNIQFQKTTHVNPQSSTVLPLSLPIGQPQQEVSFHFQMKTSRKKEGRTRDIFEPNPVTMLLSHSPPLEPFPRPGPAPGCCSAGCPSHS